jgi:hypothetical protein
MIPEKSMTDADSETVEEYPHNCRIVREHVEGSEDRYHFEGPLGRIKSFENPDKARSYADVYEVVGGFREEKTGERGVPPAVARSREDVLMAYLAAQPTMSVTYVARAFELDEDEVRSYIEMIRKRAAEMREENEE